MALTSTAMGPGWLMFFQTATGGNEGGVTKRLLEYGGPPLFTKREIEEEDELIALTMLLFKK